jgi:DNA-binding ferritin-like protein (Dps family)
MCKPIRRLSKSNQKYTVYNRDLTAVVLHYMWKWLRTKKPKQKKCLEDVLEMLMKSISASTVVTDLINPDI